MKSLILLTLLVTSSITLHATVTTDTPDLTVAVTYVQSVQQFTTVADDIAGMTVQVFFNSTTVFQSCNWGTVALGGGDAGCEVGGQFRISLTDGASGTWDGTWRLENLRSGDGAYNNITQLLLTAGSNIVFDRGGTDIGGWWQTANNEGTLNSERGWDATGSTTGAAGTAIYRGQVAIENTAPVGDLYKVLQINWTGFGAGENQEWRADTDNVTPTPEPSSIAYLALGLLAGYYVRRRRRA